MRIFLSAGEASGDAYAAALVRELRKTGADFTFEGVGGRGLASEIGKLLDDSSHWGAISFVQSLAVAPKVLTGFFRAKRALAKGGPGLLVAIDFGAVNIRICKFAKKRGWKVLYFMPPASWRRDKQGKDLPALTDVIVTPFPWSAEMLNHMGAKAHFFGHPLKQLIRESGTTRDLTAGQIAVLPGSRSHELERNLPMIAEVICGRKGDWKGGFQAGAMYDRLTPETAPLDVTLEFAVAPNLDLSAVKASWAKVAPGRLDTFTQGDVYGVLGRSQAAIVCSGTATLEAALMRCPMVVVYRITKAMMREAKLIGFKMPKFVALPNIVLDRPLVPELVHLEIDPSAINALLSPLLVPGLEREAQLAGFVEIDGVLGSDDAITKTAELIASSSRA
jgi:lipid-A-disaccharide synthase